MKRALTFSFLGAAGCHALLLFGFQVSEPVIHPVGDSGTMDVALVGEEEGAQPAQGCEAAPETAPTPLEPAAETPPLPPEPVVPDATPALDPEPVPTPSPTPVSDLKPAPQTQPALPAKPQTAPRPQTSTPRRHGSPSAPGSSKTGAGTGTGHGLIGAGTADAGVGGGGQPHYRSHPRPEYPPQARRERQEGIAFVKIQVLPDGKPGEVTLSRSSGFPLLDEAAVKGVKRWTFDPATAAGIPVSSQVEVPVRFNLLP